MASEYKLIVGKRRTANYAVAALSLLARGTRVALRARGRVISKAVDVSQIITKNPRYVISSVSIGSERLEKQGQKPVDVSTIEIVIEPRAEAFQAQEESVKEVEPPTTQASKRSRNKK